MFPPISFQLTDSVYSTQRQQTVDVVSFESTDSFFIAMAICHTDGVAWEGTFNPYYRNACFFNRLVQVFGKGVGSVDDAADIIVVAE